MLVRFSQLIKVLSYIEVYSLGINMRPLPFSYVFSKKMNESGL